MDLSPAQVEELRARIPAALRARYRLGRLLGAGGMGAVFEARVPELDKPCALKVVVEARDPRLVERFEREARILARVAHPNLVEIYDRGVEGGMPWIAMELIEGRDLRARVVAGEVLDEDALTRMARGVAGALDALHRQAIVHRDVKPGNICLDRHGRAILMDLGLALDEDRTRLTAIGSLAGTLGFLAPEVLLGGTPAASTDAYALGITLWYLLAARLPFTPDELMVMIGRGRWEPVPPVPGSAAGSPLARLAAALTALDPAARPRDLAAVEGILAEARSATRSLPRLASTSVSRALVAPGPDPGGAPDPARPRRPLAVLALPGLALCAALLGLILLRQAGPAPTEAPAPPAPGPAPALAPDPQAPPADEAGQLAWLARGLGFPAGPDPWLTLEVAFYGKDPELFARARARLAALPESGAARYFRLKAAEGAGRFDQVLEAARRLDYAAPVRGYGEAKVLLEALGHRLVLEGPSASKPDPARAAAVLADCRRVEAALAGATDFGLRLARVELWDLMARRIHLRPAVNLPGLEVADELYSALVPELAGAGGYLTAQGLLLGLRLAAHLGDAARCRVLRERFEALAVSPLADLPEARDFWLWRLREDEAKLNEPANLAIFSRGAMTMHLEPAGLPFPARRAGSGEAGARLAVPVVPDPPVPDPLRLDPEPGEDPARRLAEVSDRAVLEGRELVISPAWMEAHMGSAEAFRGPLGDQVLAWPSALLAVEDRYVEGGDERGFLQLLRRQDGLVRTRRGFTEGRRTWFRGAWAELRVRRLFAEVASGGPDAALTQARRMAEAAAKLPGPWTVAEVRGFRELWDWLRIGFDGRGECPVLEAETLRVGLRLLEGEAGARDPGARAAFARDALAWLSTWARAAGRTEPVEGLPPRLRAALGDAAPGIADELTRLEFSLGAGELAVPASPAATGCEAPGIPAPGILLPEAALPLPAGGDRARFEALLGTR